MYRLIEFCLGHIKLWNYNWPLSKDQDVSNSFHLLLKERIAVFWSTAWEEIRHKIGRDINSNHLLSDYYILRHRGLSTLHSKTRKLCVSICFYPNFSRRKQSDNQNLKHITMKWWINLLMYGLWLHIYNNFNIQNRDKLGQWKSKSNDCKIATKHSVKINSTLSSTHQVFNSFSLWKVSLRITIVNLFYFSLFFSCYGWSWVNFYLAISYEELEATLNYLCNDEGIVNNFIQS